MLKLKTFLEKTSGMFLIIEGVLIAMTSLILGSNSWLTIGLLISTAGCIINFLETHGFLIIISAAMLAIGGTYLTTSELGNWESYDYYGLTLKFSVWLIIFSQYLIVTHKLPKARFAVLSFVVMSALWVANAVYIDVVAPVEPAATLISWGLDPISTGFVVVSLMASFILTIEVALIASAVLFLEILQETTNHLFSKEEDHGPKKTSPSIQVA